MFVHIYFIRILKDIGLCKKYNENKLYKENNKVSAYFIVSFTRKYIQIVHIHSNMSSDDRNLFLTL